ncbi:HNHc domain containing protein [uncultured Caudovirales phage]|uniref:HNHc domain containing protein n=1 Tax=uncultured Caudovirales phage TaxID=2100421 RepID=A0A6J5RW55_9CAUD|nr:HNHc domain containing protein [uncultured Caudovirales phage]CAB4182501.1 HNHc domain containing protein [uncultured Caudovirales phage]CAB4197868.1 HNHc domain containing protein [uncultured Caudovirales phage]CAB4212493.1 HNHc domain containing protein [uncultured Caudovirales phage]CAB5227138.1 HNHc domain containing protein [uncultured Caudovirales phage]
MTTLRNGGEWTEARFKSFVISKLRAGLRWWPPKYRVLKNAQTERRTNTKTGKLAMHYQCAACKQDYPAKDVQVDHKQPVVNPKTGFISWDEYVERMFVEAKQLQVLCKPCHKVKSDKERKQRGKK